MFIYFSEVCAREGGSLVEDKYSALSRFSCHLITSTVREMEFQIFHGFRPIHLDFVFCGAFVHDDSFPFRFTT